MPVMYMPDPEAARLIGSIGRDPSQHYFGPRFRGDRPTVRGMAADGQGAGGLASGGAGPVAGSTPRATAGTPRIPDENLARIMGVIRGIAGAGDLRLALEIAEATVGLLGGDFGLNMRGADGGAQDYLPDITGMGSDAGVVELPSRLGLVSDELIDPWADEESAPSELIDPWAGGSTAAAGTGGQPGAAGGAPQAGPPPTYTWNPHHDTPADTIPSDDDMEAAFNERMRIDAATAFRSRQPIGQRQPGGDPTSQIFVILPRPDGGDSEVTPGRVSAFARALIPAYLRAQEQQRHRRRTTFGPGGRQSPESSPSRSSRGGPLPSFAAAIAPGTVDAPAVLRSVAPSVVARQAEHIRAGVGPGARPPSAEIRALAAGLLAAVRAATTDP